MLLQLIYISTMRTRMSDDDCRQILDVSRRNNARDAITGLLVVGGTRFIQLLEGPPTPVRAAFDRIRADQRHFAAVVLADKLVESRECADWAMGHIAGGVPTVDGRLEEVVAQLVAPIQDANLRAQFTGFAKVHASARAGS